MFKRVVVVIEILALIAAATFVIALFVYDPDSGGGGGGDGGGEATPGAEIFAANCARCHGADGGGGIGPQLSDGAVVAAFPNPVDEAILVNDGMGSMPSFEGTLSTEEIAEVVEYTRTL